MAMSFEVDCASAAGAAARAAPAPTTARRVRSFMKGSSFHSGTGKTSLALLSFLGLIPARPRPISAPVSSAPLRLVNAMFGPKLGGLEQVFVDYSEVLAMRGHAMINIVTPGALAAAPLRALGQRVVEIGNFNQWDPLEIWRLRRALDAIQPDAVIAHGNRAINLMRPAARAPFVAVNHGINV